MVEKYILDNSGNRDDARDIFQDAMYILIKKVEDANFELTSKLSTFIYGISKNLWLKNITQKKIDPNELYQEFHETDIEDDVDDLKRVKWIKHCIDQLGEPCKTIIVQFYFFKVSMQEIAEKLNYTNANNAKNQKYKCFQRLKKLANKNDQLD